jgi:hypothetical protein
MILVLLSERFDQLILCTDFIFGGMTTMGRDFINALYGLPIISEEEVRKKGFNAIHAYDDPVELAKIIPETHSGGGDICIYWAERQSKTEFEYHIYRTGESKWIYVLSMDFLD